MAIRVSCDECGQSLKVADDLAGRRVKCRCGAKIAVPADEADDIAELVELPPRRTAAGRKPRGKSGPGFSVSPRLFKILLLAAVAGVVCTVGVYVVQWGAGIATMAGSMQKIAELKKSTMAVIDPSIDRLRKNRDDVENLVRNRQTVPTEEAVRPLLDQIAAESNALLTSLAALPVPEGLVDGSEFVEGWRDTIRNQSDLLTKGIPPLVELRNDDSRDAKERVLEAEIGIAELRIKNSEALLAMLARHLEFYKKNKTGMSPSEVGLRQNIESKLDAARNEQRWLIGQRKKPAGTQVAAGGPSAGTPDKGSPSSGPRPGMDFTKPETWGDTPVPTDEIKSIDGLKRGMKIWVHGLRWEPAEILGPGQNGSIVIRMAKSEAKIQAWQRQPAPSLRIAKSEFERADLKDVPLFAADTVITDNQVREMNGQPPLPPPITIGPRRGSPGGPRNGGQLERRARFRGGMRGAPPDGQSP